MKKGNQFLHDHLFREVYDKPRYGQDLFEMIFSEEEMALFDWSALRTETTSFINAELREKRMDLLFSARLKGSEEWVRALFLVEHKSQNDPDLMRQFLGYQTGIYTKTRDPVIPIFINQSPNKVWKGPLEFQDFLNNFDGEFRRRFKDNVLNFKARSLNIQDLGKGDMAGLTTRPILYILKHIWNLDEVKLRELFTISRGLSKKDREALVLRAVDYVRRYDPHFTWNIIITAEKQTIKEGEAIMTPLLQSSLEEARQKGRQEGQQEGWQKGQQEGWQKGQQEVVFNMLREKLSPSLISKMTSFSEEEIKKLKNSNS